MVSKIGDMEWGSGYRELEVEFDETLRKIPAMGYGLVMISHAGEATMKDDEGEDFTKIVPTLSKSAKKVVSRMADVYGYIRIVANPDAGEEGQPANKTLMYLRGTPYFEAGSRFPYTPAYIESNYDNLNNAIADSIAQQEEEGAEVVDTADVNVYEETGADFAEEMERARVAIEALVEHFTSLEDEAETLAGQKSIQDIVDKHLGEGNKLNEATESQVDMVVLVVQDLEALVKEVGL